MLSNGALLVDHFAVSYDKLYHLISYHSSYFNVKCSFSYKLK